MKTILALVGIVAILFCIWYYNSSPSDRAVARDRIDRSIDGRTASGASVGGGLPDIVQRQQDRERLRQNTQWTAENQALHPIEYCQAQLETVANYGRKLETVLHEVTVKECSTKRSIEDSESTIKSIRTFLVVAKAAYRQSEASNAWPVVINGFSLSQVKAQEKIVDATQRIEPLQGRIGSMRNMLVLLSKKRERIVVEQKKIEKIRESIQNTLTDLQTKKVIDGSKEIVASISAINDSMAGLGNHVDDPSVEDLIMPDKEEILKKTFQDIMKD